MALTAVDLSLAAKRIATPTLDHDLILGNTALAVGSRAGVASLEAIKDLIVKAPVSGTAPSSPSAGKFWWDTSGNPDAGLKIRVGSAWVPVGSSTSNSDIDDRIVSWALANSPTGTVPHRSPIRGNARNGALGAVWGVPSRCGCSQESHHGDKCVERPDRP